MTYGAIALPNYPVSNKNNVFIPPLNKGGKCEARIQLVNDICEVCPPGGVRLKEEDIVRKKSAK
jgi:hypothetical protein